MIRSIKLPFKVSRPILACGADMKGAFALAKGNDVFVIDGFGDLNNPDNLTKYERAVIKYQKKLGIKPQVIACDLHPDYFSTRFAENYTLHAICYPLYKIQHHEAHIASAIVDNSVKGDVIGAAFDGTGYGSDGNVWGGEFFVGGLKGFKRAAHLEYVPMPGGEKVIKEPWRMAVSYLYRAFGHIRHCEPRLRPYRVVDPEGRGEAISLFRLLRRIRVISHPPRNDDEVQKRNIEIILEMIGKNINSPLTSSAGRLFDAVGSIVLSKNYASKEAELPIELEALASGRDKGIYKFDIKSRGGNLIIGTSPVIKGIIADLSGEKDKAAISRKFHNTIADIILKISLKLSGEFKLKQVVLSGGVFQNKYLTAITAEALKAKGLKVYLHSDVPTNDYGIPVGQIAIANARAACA